MNIHRFDYCLQDIFSFESRDIVTHMMYNMKLGDKFKESFVYLQNKMEIQEFNSLEKLKWDKGKSYDWAGTKKENVIFIIRKYRSHFTVFYKVEKKNDDYYASYGCFTYHTDKDKLPKELWDVYPDNDFIELNKSISDIFKLIADGLGGMLWNSASLPRPKYVNIKTIWSGGVESVSSIDEFIYCCEEIFSRYLEIFSKTDMLEKIKEFKVGQILNNKYEIIDIRTDVKNEYYHGVGLTLKGTNGRESEDWKDVYSLTRWYLDDVFKTKSVN